MAIANNQTNTLNQFNIDLTRGENSTIVLIYNITTRYSYFITFRSFGYEQLKFGLFKSTNKSEENSIEIFYENYITELFIVCFHFIVRFNDLDIQCEDLRILKNDKINSTISKDFLPSYNPLFVPMMYALSVLMLLPVIIQHHQHKKEKLLERQKQLRRLSITITQDDSSLAKNILSEIVENGSINYDNLPVNIELLSLPSTKTMFDILDDDSIHSTTRVLKRQPFAYDSDDYDYYIDREKSVDAHECVAHLLDNTPWNTKNIEEPLTTSPSRHAVIRDSARAIKEQYFPTIVSFNNEEDDDYDYDGRFFIESNKHSIVKSPLIKRIFFESDV